MAKGHLKATVRQPSFTEIREMFLSETKDGEPSDIPPGISRKQRKLDPMYDKIAAAKKRAREATRDIICMGATGKRYADLEKEAQGILSATECGSKAFEHQLKSFLALISIHTYETPGKWNSEERPALRLTEEFWQKEWVRPTFKRIRELDSALVARVYHAMAAGATEEFISKKTRGKDLVVYIAINAFRWERTGAPWREIVEELRQEGFGDWISTMVDSPGRDKSNLEKAINAFRQSGIYFDKPGFFCP